MSHKLSMKKVKEVMRLKHSGLSHRQIGISINASTSTVSDCLSRARLAGLSWPLDESVSEEELSTKLYAVSVAAKLEEEPVVDWSKVHRELKRKGVTLQLLWQEEKTASLSHCQWVKEHRNILIVGPTGTGKTFLASALAHKACLEGYSVSYQRMPRLMGELSLGRGDGTYTGRMKELSKSRILILDDWGLVPLELMQRRDLLEILEDRQGNGSTVITSQLPVKLWHDAINDATLADAILDRVVHNAYRIELKGESMRKIKANALTE